MASFVLIRLTAIVSSCTSILDVESSGASGYVAYPNALQCVVVVLDVVR